MDKNITKVVEIMNEEFEKNGKSYYIMAIEIDWEWSYELTASWSITTNELIVAKYMVDKHIDDKIFLGELDE